MNFQSTITSNRRNANNNIVQQQQQQQSQQYLDTQPLINQLAQFQSQQQQYQQQFQQQQHQVGNEIANSNDNVDVDVAVAVKREISSMNKRLKTLYDMVLAQQDERNTGLTFVDYKFNEMNRRMEELETKYDMIHSHMEIVDKKLIELYRSQVELNDNANTTHRRMEQFATSFHEMQVNSLASMERKVAGIIRKEVSVVQSEISKQMSDLRTATENAMQMLLRKTRTKLEQLVQTDTTMETNHSFLEKRIVKIEESMESHHSDDTDTYKSKLKLKEEMTNEIFSKIQKESERICDIILNKRLEEISIGRMVKESVNNAIEGTKIKISNQFSKNIMELEEEVRNTKKQLEENEEKIVAQIRKNKNNIQNLVEIISKQQESLSLTKRKKNTPINNNHDRNAGTYNLNDDDDEDGFDVTVSEEIFQLRRDLTGLQQIVDKIRISSSSNLNNNNNNNNSAISLVQQQLMEKIIKENEEKLLKTKIKPMLQALEVKIQDYYEEVSAMKFKHSHINNFNNDENPIGNLNDDDDNNNNNMNNLDKKTEEIQSRIDAIILKNSISSTLDDSDTTSAFINNNLNTTSSKKKNKEGHDDLYNILTLTQPQSNDTGISNIWTSTLLEHRPKLNFQE